MKANFNLILDTIKEEKKRKENGFITISEHVP